MCGICGRFSPSSCCALASDPGPVLRALAHRGPDGAAHLALSPHSYLGFTRLSLVGDSRQPFLDGSCALVCNGEIYNHEELRLALPPAAPSTASSDCSILLPCIAAWGIEQTLRQLDGMFALAMVASVDDATQDVYLARDRLGIKPLLWGLCDSKRCLAFASEAGGVPASWKIADVAPGHLVHLRVASGAAVEVVRDVLFLPPWSASPQREPVTSSALRAALISAVQTHVMGDHPVGVFLSGGLDSSLLAAITARLARQRGARLQAYTISYAATASVPPGGAPPAASADLAFARQTAAFIGADLACFTFDATEALSALEDVIERLESADVGLVRVAVPLYLLAKKAAAAAAGSCRAVLVGEGADEVFAGYALFRSYARDALPAFEAELARRLACISASELLRVDRCTMAWGVEARVPFLDASFLALAMHASCAERKLSHPSTGRLEKCLLRDAFVGWLPDDVLYRRKEGMADGVGFDWVRDVQRAASEREAIADPDAAEAALYRRLFRGRAAASRVALADARRAARNAQRPVPLARLIDGSAFIRGGCKSVRDDPQLCDLFTEAEAVAFCARVLGVDVAARPPTLALLNALIEAVLARIPFHNFALLTRPRVPPTRAEVRDDWLRVLGGTCAYTAPAFAAVLSRLGFSVSLVAATVRRDFDHLALLVLVAGRFHYVDVGNGKRYLEAAPLGDEQPRGSPASFAWRLRWDAAAACFQVVHGRRSFGSDSELAWDAAASITFDPTRLVHYSFFHEHFARGRLDAANVFRHGLRFAVFPRLDTEVSIRDARVTLGSTRLQTPNEAALLAFARPRMSAAQLAWLGEALGALRAQGDALWPAAGGAVLS